MFSAVYESCLESAPLIRLSPPDGSPSHNNKSDDKTPITVGDVVRDSRYVIFCILRGAGRQDRSEKMSKFFAEFFAGIRALTLQKNGLRKNSNGSPTRLKKLLKSLKISKKSGGSSSSSNSISYSTGTAELFVSTIVLDLDPNALPFNICAIEEPGFYYLPLNLQQYQLKGQLLRALNFSGVTPALAIVDAAQLCVLTSQGRRMLAQDPKGEQFPWTDPSTDGLFEGKFLRNVRVSPANNSNGGSAAPAANGDSRSAPKFVAEEVDFSAIKPRVKALFFGAKWCPPCREVVKQLAVVYESLKAKLGDDFELFFCSSDRSETSFRENFSTMPWCALPFGKNTLTPLTRAYDVSGIPTVLLLDEQNRVISRHGRSLLLSDPHGQRFPWPRTPLIELTEFNVHQIADGVSLILFTEGQPDDGAFAQSVLQPAAEVLFAESQHLAASNGTGKQSEAEQQQEQNPTGTNGNGEAKTDEKKPVVTWRDPIQVFFTGDDPICDHILETFNQEEAPLPLLLICDMFAGHVAVCDLPDVNEEIVIGFVDDYRAGRANVSPLPTATKRPAADAPATLVDLLLHDQSPNHDNAFTAGGSIPPSPAVGNNGAGDIVLSTPQML